MDRKAAMASSRSASRCSSGSPRVWDPRTGGQAQEKPYVGLVRMVRDQGPQDLQGLGKPVASRRAAARY